MKKSEARNLAKKAIDNGKKYGIPMKNKRKTK